MESEINQTTFDVKVYFVLPNKYESNEDCDEDMWDAYNKCSDWDINPEWILEKKCLKLKPTKKDVFVMEEFEGDTYNKLQNFNCTIVGPRCLLSCFLTGQPIPDGSTPIFNTAMRGLVVTASGFATNVKDEIQRIVEYMGGIFTKQLRASVTHLVTDNVMSAKYERAVELQKTIVTIDWVKSVWDTNLKESILATDSQFDKYKCPVFFNLFVTSTNLNKKQKDEIKKLITSNGGEFMGVLDGSKIKIVITLETSSLSDKLKYAMQNNIPCLKIEWVYESLAAGYSLPFHSYLIKSTQACSTPEKTTTAEPFNFSTISVIPAENHNQCVDETVASTTVMSSTVMNTTLSIQNAPAIPKINYITVLERLNIAEAKKAGTFLDGCNIYLTGFSSNYRDKLNKIVNVGSATRLDEISDALTHVIVGDPFKATQDLRFIKSKGLNPYILKVDWLEECMKLQAPAPEDNFLFDRRDGSNQTLSEPQSPLSKKNLQLLQKPKIPAAPLFNDSKIKDSKITTVDEHSEIVQQYLQQNSSESNDTLRKMLKLPSNENFGNNLNTSKNQTLAERWNETTRKDNETTFSAEQRDDSMIPISQESYIQKMLKGLVFLIIGFKDDEYLQLVEQIRNLGGKIVGKNYTGIPDYGIVPSLGIELKNTVGEIVTDLFIEDCIDSEKLVHIEYYHRPIILSSSAKPLANCVIGMSTYTGAERTYLSRLSEVLGARYQDTFARKTNLQKNTYSSTHLICPKPQGDKYGAAVKWGLPAVTADWLTACATEMKLLDETDYLVGETMAPDRTIITTNSNVIKGNESTVMKPPIEHIKRQTFMNTDQLVGGSCETPVINKRLNNLINNKTPQSPFHISTPETPYGQIFKENPSPRTRKAWVKWIDHFPDVPMETPPPKRKRSTPLSDIKRMAWDFVTGRLDSQETNVVNPVENKTAIDTEQGDGNEPSSSHIHTNRKLSYSEDNSPNKTTLNPAISFQIAQLDKMLQRASNTPESRQSASGEYSNLYHLEPNFPSGTCLVKESQPDSVGWEDPVKRVPPQRRLISSEIHEKSELEDIVNDEEMEIEPKEEVCKPKFMFSGIKDKGIAEKLIIELGGEVSTEPAYDPTATHLLCLKPARNEKILSSIAAGKWVLHYSYIEACKVENKLLNEEEFELGNTKSKGVIPDPSNENEKTIMNAAHRWRLKLLENPGGAFQHMVALLLTPKEKKEQFVRLIRAGGGVVVTAEPPYDSSPKGRKITHCFIQLKQIDQQVDWAMMANKGIMCFPPQYLNEHLMSESPLNPRDCVLPEFQKYLALMPK